jgi:ubiquinone/menaquinone biosynthesis C-methylase UbiE
MQEGLPFADNSARVITADLSLHYFSSTVTRKIIGEISRVLVDGGYLIGRVNSVKDTEYGAGHGVKLEDNYYCIKGRYKRFFDRPHLEDFFPGWSLEYVNECTMDRYPKPKLVWEFSAKNLKLSRT